MDSRLPVRFALVSASPRRRELLSRLAIPFEVLPSSVAEQWTATDPPSLAMANARRKVEASPMRGDPARLLLGADTLIAVDGDIFGKPAGLDSARRMLQRLSDRWHEVVTGVCLSGPDGTGGAVRDVIGVAISRVRFRPLTRADVTAYLATGEWRGKAGAYAIQDAGRSLVDTLDGDFDNVVGLPLELIRELLEEHFGHCRFLR